MPDEPEFIGVCVHFPDDPNAVCTMCKPKPPIPEPDPWDFKMMVTAIYYGTCSKCDMSIHPGDTIIRDGESWRHADCRAHG